MMKSSDTNEEKSIHSEAFPFPNTTPLSQLTHYDIDIKKAPDARTTRNVNKFMVLPPLDLEWIVLQLKSPMLQFCTKATLTTQPSREDAIRSFSKILDFDNNSDEDENDGNQ
ncbi:hypothetical protein DEO72_LG8g2015 [Vigna unguiculata]|uniref:Uncharacterized protein n=1 Tax=Vigna unguiculata TaxID=3917 RepID=A0A4D6MRE0_VIGUN|nr:hypothetical protein DEO72_LG8g2015 [Vigna unguiculata]